MAIAWYNHSSGTRSVCLHPYGKRRSTKATLRQQPPKTGVSQTLRVLRSYLTAARTFPQAAWEYTSPEGSAGWVATDSLLPLLCTGGYVKDIVWKWFLRLQRTKGERFVGKVGRTETAVESRHYVYSAIWHKKDTRPRAETGLAPERQFRVLPQRTAASGIG